MSLKREPGPPQKTTWAKLYFCLPIFVDFRVPWPLKPVIAGNRKAHRISWNIFPRSSRSYSILYSPHPPETTQSKSTFRTVWWMIFFTSFAARMPKDTLRLELKGKVVTVLPSQMALSIRLIGLGPRFARPRPRSNPGESRQNAR